MTCIKIVGLGGGNLKQLPLGVLESLEEADRIILRTADHPVVAELEKRGLSLSSYDSIYTDYEEDFDQIYPAIVEDLIKQAKNGPLVYAVPGHPMVGESTTQLLLQQKEVAVEIVGGHSFIDDLFQAVGIDPIEGLQLVDGMDLAADLLQSSQHLIIMQIAHPLIAGDVKIELMKVYPDEHEIYCIDGAGTDHEELRTCPLYELDHFEGVHNLLSVYVPPLAKEEDMRSFSTTQSLVDAIVDPDRGDPWVLAHDPRSLWPFLKEESLELKEAIDNDDSDAMIEELGDVLMQVFYHAKLAENRYDFSLEDVLETLNKKLWHRHPHIFSDVQVDSIEDVEKLWQDIKEREKEGGHEAG